MQGTQAVPLNRIYCSIRSILSMYERTITETAWCVRWDFCFLHGGINRWARVAMSFHISLIVVHQSPYSFRWFCKLTFVYGCSYMSMKLISMLDAFLYNSCFLCPTSVCLLWWLWHHSLYKRSDHYNYYANIASTSWKFVWSPDQCSNELWTWKSVTKKMDPPEKFLRVQISQRCAEVYGPHLK